ncbi:MAG: quinone-dependent dihydroorotate dehydrogenase [Bdellovibrionales bacterium]
MKPWLWIPPKLAHDLGPMGLNFYAKFTPPVESQWKSVTWGNLKFRNPVGIAGGVDKNARQISAWKHFGAGFLEIGTVTPQAQKPNPGRVILRDVSSRTLWNRLGFPNDGAGAIKARLKTVTRTADMPLFVNIGKNRITDLEDAHKDYTHLIEEFQGLADAFVINISSPNTSGLRDLLKSENIDLFLKNVSEKPSSVPLLLKLSPDMDESQMEALLSASLKQNISGWILTNTTLDRWNGSPYPAEGGVSGQFLNAKSKLCLKRFLRLLGSEKKDRLVISVGGIMTPKDVEERLEIGADLVQAYTALIYEGPMFFDRVRCHFKS